MNTQGSREPPGIVFMDGRHNWPAMTGKARDHSVSLWLRVSFFFIPLKP